MDKKNIIFFYTIFSLWMVLEYFILGPFSLVRIHDSADIHLPRLIYFASNFLNEGLTYWSPQMGAGVDRLSNGFSIYYFLTILFILLKPWIAYSSFYFIQHFISSYFTYRICRDTLHLDKLSALVAGVLFSYVQAYQFDFGLGFSAFPMIIWISDKIMFNPVRWKYLKIISLGLGYSFVAPFHMSIVYTLPTILLWKLLIRNCYDIKVYLNLLLFSIFCILPQLDLIQSLILNSQDSHRIGRDYSLQNFGGGLFSYSIEVTISILKNNILPLSLTIFAFHLSLKKIKYFHNLIFTIILLLTITAISRPLVYFFGDYIGFLSGFQFDRISRLIPFYFALLGGLSCSLLMEEYHFIPLIKNKMVKLKKVIITSVFSIIFIHSVYIKGLNGFQWVTEGSYYSNFKNPTLIDFNESVDKDDPFRVATILSHYSPAFTNAYMLESVDGYMNIYPKNYQSYWFKIIEKLFNVDKNTNIKDNFLGWGNKVFLFRDADFTSREYIEFSKYYNLDLLSLINTKYIISFVPLKDKDLQLFQGMQFQNNYDWFKISKIERAKRSIFEHNFKGKPLFIYENKNALPRWFLADKIIPYDNIDSLYMDMSYLSANKLKNNVFLNDSIKMILDSTKMDNSNYTITKISYNSDEIVLNVANKENSILVITNSYNPNWKCEVDGIPREIFKAYGLFWAIKLDSGDHIVEFSYKPSYKLF